MTSDHSRREGGRPRRGDRPVKRAHINSRLRLDDLSENGTSSGGYLRQNVRVARRSSGCCEAEEHDDRPCESGHVVVAQPADPFAEFRAWNGGDLVDHEPARMADAGLLVGINRYAEQRSIGVIGGERTDGDRSRGVEEIVLDDDNRTRFAGVAAPGGGGPAIADLVSIGRTKRPIIVTSGDDVADERSSVTSIEAWAPSSEVPAAPDD